MTTTQMQQLAYAQSEATADQSNLCLTAAFELFGEPDTLLDVGCGSGNLVDLANSRGIPSRGVDICCEDSETLTIHDLTEPLFTDPADLVLCLEVGEHLPKSAASTLADSLARAVASQGMLIFSAATPGQGGAGHVNEQPHEYWIDMLSANYLFYDEASTAEIQFLWSYVAPDAWWYGKNALVFRG